MFEAFTFLVFLAGAVAVSTAFGRKFYGTRERRLLLAATIAHGFATVAQVIITRDYYGGGDMFLYFRQGTLLREYVLTDFLPHFVELLGLIARADHVLPFYIVGEGGSTGSMTGIAALLLLMTGGSLYGAAFLASMVALVGQVAVFQAFRPFLPKTVRIRALAAVLLVPSVIYWTSALLKESVAMGGVGLLVFAVTRLLFQPRSLFAVPIGLFGLALVGSVKPYFIFPLIIASGAWVIAVYWQGTSGRRNRGLPRFAVLVAAVALALLMVVQAGRLFPRYSLDNVSVAAADSREAFYRTDGGSNYQYAAEESEGGFTGTIAIVPLALVAALFRPVVFEAHNVTSFINSLEMSAVSILLFVGLRSRGFDGAKRLLSDSPILVFLLVFVLASGAAIGMSAPNLGSLSRYRAPMIPMYLLFVILLIPTKQLRRST